VIRHLVECINVNNHNYKQVLSDSLMSLHADFFPTTNSYIPSTNILSVYLQVNVIPSFH
jgi:hypothetical protein